MLAEAPRRGRTHDSAKLVRKYKATGVLYDFAVTTLKKIYGSHAPTGKVAVGWCYSDVEGRFQNGWEVTTSKIVNRLAVEDGLLITTYSGSKYVLPIGESANEVLQRNLRASIARTRGKPKQERELKRAKVRRASETKVLRGRVKAKATRK